MTDIIIHESYQKFCAEHVICETEVFEILPNELDEFDKQLVSVGVKALLLYLRIDDMLFRDISFNCSSNCSCCDNKNKFNTSMQLVIDEKGFHKLWMIVTLMRNKSDDIKFAFPITMNIQISLARGIIFMIPKSEKITRSIEEHMHAYAIKFDVNVLQEMKNCTDYVFDYMRERNLPR